jgi:Phosphotransferase enzyme family
VTVVPRSDYGPPGVHAAERPALSVVVTTDDQFFVDDLERALGASVELIVVSTRALRVLRGRAVQVFGLESAYRRNRGLLLAEADRIAFLEDGQLPSPQWLEGVEAAFAGSQRPAAAVGGRDRAPLHEGGNVVYDRVRLLAARGFPLFTGAPPASPVPDLLLLLRLRAEGEHVVVAPQMMLTAPRSAAGRDTRRVGRVLRIYRKPVLAARAVADAVGRRAPHELATLVSGAIIDTEWPFEPPDARVGMPAQIAAAVSRRALAPLQVGRKGKLHFLYRAQERMLHLYIGPTDHLREAVVAREVIRERSGAAGIPRIHASEEGTDSLWVVEDFVSGTPLDGARLRQTADRVAAWVVALGGREGRPLGAVSAWRAHAAELLAAGFPETIRSAVAHSLRAVENVAARHLHGDLNPRNVLVDGNTLTAVDWENAAAEFIPGLDLIFVFLLADGKPDERVIIERAGLAPWLRKLGLSDQLIPHALRVILATWALGERKRRARLGVDPGPAVFESLLLRSEGLLG